MMQIFLKFQWAFPDHKWAELQYALSGIRAVDFLLDNVNENSHSQFTKGVSVHKKAEFMQKCYDSLRTELLEF